MKINHLLLFAFVLLFAFSALEAKNIAYIHGDVSDDGDIPSGPKSSFHQMLLTDTGDRGCSIFRNMVESKGHTITQHYDAQTELTPEFLEQYDVIIFTLHQKVWSPAEKAALDDWIHEGGSIFMFSDSAAGGHFNLVGLQNPIGQLAVNSILTDYGMQVTVDQANGVKAYRAGPGASHPIVVNRPILEGEGVSPVAIDPDAGVIALIPYVNHNDYKVFGNPVINHLQNITIQNPEWAALALKSVGNGFVIAMFDRQPIWNNGPGSDISKRDNFLILERIIDFTTSGGNIQRPVVSFTEPLSGASFEYPEDVYVEVDASDEDGFISKVELRVNGDLKETDTIAPYSFNLTGLTPGNYTLQARAYNNNGVSENTSISITVTGVVIVPVYGVTIGGCPGTILLTGDTHQLIANVAPENATDKNVTWSSSSTQVATVDSTGLVTAISQGSVTITVTTNDGGFSRTCTMGIMSTGVSVTGVTLSGCPGVNLKIDSTYQLTAHVTPSNADDLQVSWSSSDESVATVDENGLITALSAGETTITAITSDGGYSDECKLVVDIANSTNEITNNSYGIKVYPNPVQDKLFFEFPGSGLQRTITVYNALGQLLLSENTNNNHFDIDVRNFLQYKILIVGVFSFETAKYFKVLVKL